MRLLRYLPALLTLLVPLVFLFWWGSAEFSRLEGRANSILQNEAYSFLRNADTRVRDLLRTKATRRLQEIVSLNNRSPVEAARESSIDDLVLDLFLLDTQGNLLYPRLPQFRQPSVPLRSLPQSNGSAERLYLRARLLESLGDQDGALQKLAELQRRLQNGRRGAVAHQYLLMRCLFDLAGLRARAGQTEAAKESYDLAGRMAENMLGRGSGPVGEDSAAVVLLSEAAHAELGREPPALLEVLTDISLGLHDSNADDLLDAVFQRVAAAIPTEAPEQAAVRGARQDNEVRKAGRRFAREYQALAATSVRKRLAQAQQNKEPGPFYHVLNTPQGSLLAIRRADMTEQLEHGAGWVGVRLDVAAALSKELLAAINPQEGSFFSLAILSPDGDPILPLDPPSAAESPVQPAPVTSLANLRLQAIPVHPGVDAQGDVQEAERNRLYLVLALIFVAAGGAVFLMRSVSRESELARLKVQLVSRVSHELKTPLAVIKMYGDTLCLGRARDKEQVAKFAGIISRESDRLTGMIERILDFSRKEAGTLTYTREDVNLSELLADLTDEYREHVLSRGAELNAELSDDLHVTVDQEAMTSAFVNLVENAVKYTPEDSKDRAIQINLSRQNGSAVLEVRDRGVGIPRREQQEVFSPFYRASTAGEVRGAGLGLNLVRHFAQSHGGDIEALSRPDGGTIMRLTLPLTTDSKDPSTQPAS